MRKFIIALSAVAGLGLGQAHAAAVTIQMNSPIFDSLGSNSGTITFPQFSNPSASQSLSVAAGRFVGSASALVDIAPEVFVDDTSNVFMYCYDVYNAVKTTTNYTVDLNGATSNTLQFLHGVNSVLSLNTTYDPYAWLRPQDKWQAAAIQLGIWESQHDTGWDLSSGQFRTSGFNSQTMAQATTFFNAIDGNSLDASFTMVLRHPDRQDVITGYRPDGSVPIPGTLALLIPALAGLTITRRRNQS